MHSVGFADSDFYHVRLDRAEKPVISDIFTDTLFLPRLPVLVLKTQGVILGKAKGPIVLKSAIRRHGILSCPAIVPRMLGGSTLQVIRRPDFQNEPAFSVDVVPNIEKLFFTPWRTVHVLTFTRWAGVRTPQPSPGYLGLRFWTRVSSKLSPPTLNAIWRSLFVTWTLSIENSLCFSKNSASSAIRPPFVALGLRCRWENWKTVGFLRVPV